MAYSARILRQLGNPSGLLGRLILWQLNRVNRGMNDAAYRALDLSGGDRVLDIGFGGGALVEDVLAHDGVALVAGTDISRLAVDRATRRFRRAVGAGEADFRVCGETSLPFGDGAFSKVCCVNVIYFWPDAPAMIAEVFRVLSPGGAFVLCYAEGAPDKVTKFPSEAVEVWLHDAGFEHAATTHDTDEENGRYHCTVATKPVRG